MPTKTGKNHFDIQTEVSSTREFGHWWGKKWAFMIPENERKTTEEKIVNDVWNRFSFEISFATAKILLGQKKRKLFKIKPRPQALGTHFYDHCCALFFWNFSSFLFPMDLVYVYFLSHFFLFDYNRFQARKEKPGAFDPCCWFAIQRGKDCYSIGISNCFFYKWIRFVDDKHLKCKFQTFLSKEIVF